MIDKSKPLYTLTVGEFLELQKTQFSQPSEKRDETSYLTFAETCKILNVAESTLYSYTSKRIIPFIKRGRKLQFLKTDIENLLASSRKATKEEICNSCL